MTTTEQNTNWARLTPEFRAHVKAIFAECRNNLHVTSLCANAKLLKGLFGLHNLTSTTDPEEMLMVKRSLVQRVYASIQNIIDPTSESYIKGKLSAYYEIFGDKCLPDTNTVL